MPDNLSIKKILFITLNNIGDVLLTLPVLDCLRANFKEAKITVFTGSRPKEIFENNPYIDKVIVFNKHMPAGGKIELFYMLAREKFDMVVDLRNTLLGALLPARHKTFTLWPVPKGIKHMRGRHLYKISNLKFLNINLDLQEKSLYITKGDEGYIKKILKDNRIIDSDRLIIIAAGAMSHTKRWPQEKFVELIRGLSREFKMKIVLVGDNEDIPINRCIKERSSGDVLDLTGKTTLPQLGFLLKQSSLLIANDSAVLHMASYLNVPVVAIFGITDESKYGPWSDSSIVVKKDIQCRPCENGQCRFNTLECIGFIKPEDVLTAAKRLLAANHRIKAVKYDYERILIARTDRIGDVLLSTPVIKALRENYPFASIAMVINPYAREIIDGNPYLDEVIVYDKEDKHKSWMASFKFSQELKRKKFDLAIVLHPTNRMHLISFFAGIPRRVGYNRKLGFLLTDRLKHTKQAGEKHESEYNLDLLRYLGIEPKDAGLFMPIKQESERWVTELFASEGITDKDKLLGIHPGASCPSKIWLVERFADTADKLIDRYGFRVLVLSGPKDIDLAQNVLGCMKHKAVNLAGKTTVSQLASLLKRCNLLISNDSGPVHIASALGAPVISIFGRNDPGLGPKRWGPLGANVRAIHKQIGCAGCLAHNCIKGFACLKAISADEVLKIADEILKEG